MPALLITAIAAFVFALFTPTDAGTVFMSALGGVSLVGALVVRVVPDDEDQTYVHPRTFHRIHRQRDRGSEPARAVRHHLEDPTS